MTGATALMNGGTAGGLLLVAAIMLPVAGFLLQLVLGSRFVNLIAALVFTGGLVIALAIFATIWKSGKPLVYSVGGWAPPLGIELRADGISAAMILVTAIVMCGTALFARTDFGQKRDAAEARAPFVFWPILYAIWSGLSTIFVSGDLFNLYVALELLTFAAVPLVSLKGGQDTIRAALRYLLLALLGSMLYLLGTAMLYGTYGTLDIVQLSEQARSVPLTWAAAALMTTGLFVKTALFPLHLWLPPAHAGAPPAGSAVLSALVVKGSFFLTVRLWFDALPDLASPMAAQFPAILGSAAILFGSVLALRQQRLKLLVAYSTVAQIGYLFFLFPLVSAAADPWSGFAWTGAWLQLISHALAKASMFMAAGLIAVEFGHDRIADLKGAGHRLPLTFITFGLAGFSLMGIPPSGGFTAKWLLLLASVMEGQWWWAIVIVLGGLLAGGYVFKVLGTAFGERTSISPGTISVARSSELIALGLALCAVMLGFMPLQPSEFLQIGRPVLSGTAP